MASLTTVSTKVLGKCLRVFRLGKQNTTKSLSSRRREYVSGVAARAPAAQIHLAVVEAAHLFGQQPTFEFRRSLRRGVHLPLLLEEKCLTRALQFSDYKNVAKRVVVWKVLRSP
jgi:hypothetical protein